MQYIEQVSYPEGVGGANNNREEDVGPYLAAVRTLAKHHAEALPAGRQRTQPLAAKERKKEIRMCMHTFYVVTCLENNEGHICLPFVMVM